ncbi:MAG: efflux transporter outer membrane subunit [Ostreibacterium sp.]
MKTVSVMVIMLALGGCVNFAPRYKTPIVPISEQWVGTALSEQQSASSISADTLGWRLFFRDSRLQKLIETALEYNHDLRRAALNVEIAENQYGITRADALPTVNTSASYTRTNNGKQYQAGLGVNNFELDFFGRVKNLSAAALNQYLATQEARDAAQLSIINAVTKAYYQWRVSGELKTLAQKTLVTRQQTDKLIQLRFQEGLSSGTDLSTTKSSIATARSSHQQQLRSEQQAKNALITLIGKPISSLNLPQASALSKQFSQNKLFVGIPAETLLKRPDVRQAEYGLKAGNANIGAARAAMFPRITLTGSAGYLSPEFSDLFQSGSQIWSFSPSLNLPIFDAGKRKANVRISELNQKVLIETYQSTVQSAFRDVADALVARETLDKQYSAELRGQQATEETLQLVKLQVQEGLADGLVLLESERNDFNARQRLLSTQRLMLDNRVALYTALGGGLTEMTTDK